MAGVVCMARGKGKEWEGVEGGEGRVWREERVRSRERGGRG